MPRTRWRTATSPPWSPLPRGLQPRTPASAALADNRAMKAARTNVRASIVRHPSPSAAWVPASSDLAQQALLLRFELLRRQQAAVAQLPELCDLLEWVFL